jgi:hypothetical protein
MTRSPSLREFDTTNVMPAAEFHIVGAPFAIASKKRKYNGRFAGATSWAYSSAVHRFWKFFPMKKIRRADFISFPWTASLLHETDVLQPAGFRRPCGSAAGPLQAAMR